MNDDDPESDLQELFELSQPHFSPVNVDAITRTTEPTGTHHQSKRRWGMSIRTAVMASIAAGVLYFLAIPMLSNDGIAFAQVKEQIERVRTVDFIQTSFAMVEEREGVQRTNLPPDKTAQGALNEAIEAVQRKVETVADAGKRKDAEVHLEMLKRLEEQGQTKFKNVEDMRRVRIKGKQLERIDFYLGDAHYVRSAATGLNVFFDHNRKMREVLTKQVVLNNKTGKSKEYEIKKIPPSVDFFARFRSIPVEDATKLGKKQMDGKEVIGFRTVEKHKNGTMTRTYWVSTVSNLPVRIESDFRSGRIGLADSKWIQSDFVFDRKMSDELFSTDTPDGYTSKDGEIQAIEL